METIAQYAQTYRVFFRLIPIIIATILWYSVLYRILPILRDNALDESLESLKKSFGAGAGKTMFYFFKGIVPFMFGAFLYSSLYYVKDPVQFTNDFIQSIKSTDAKQDKQKLKPLEFNKNYIVFGLFLIALTLSPFVLREKLSSKWEINILNDLIKNDCQNSPYMFKRYRANLKTLYGSASKHYYRFHLLRSMYYLLQKRNMDARNALFETMESSKNHPEYLYTAQKYLIEILMKSKQEEQVLEISKTMLDEKSLNLTLVSSYITDNHLKFSVEDDVA
ncbi:MAG: hypothetical protein COB02_17935 [Candidatus Cloacimonadota bacterium]|nr:MAG: hypothetical protein COB02_17935 [Candidatus Cloacimonadota bacterium]